MKAYFKDVEGQRSFTLMTGVWKTRIIILDFRLEFMVSRERQNEKGRTKG